MTAKARYDALSADRSQFLNMAEEAAELTLPYIIRGHEEHYTGAKYLKTPWQSVGAKGVVTLASKLMLALLPPQTSFFKLQLDESGLDEDYPPEVKTELDLSFAKIERVMNEAIDASEDRVIIHQALKHLVVAGNALIFMGEDKLKLYPLNRYVVERDGNGNVIEIVTRERINRKLLEGKLPEVVEEKTANEVMQSMAMTGKPEEVDVYTHVQRENNRVVWYQEVDGKRLPKSFSKAPLETNPWIALRFNVVDGEVYGRGRVEEFIGDLKSLESLSQSLVEGAAVSSKVVFLLRPSATTKPDSLARAGNGAIIQGQPEDLTVVQVGKAGDLGTAFEMAGILERRLSDAFLVLNVRDSERTTAEEVRMTQMELESQLGGLFSLLTVEFLVPYLGRKMAVFQKLGKIPRLPKKLVKPVIVAGINALGRGQDRESLGQFLTTITQTIGPEALIKYINPDEVIKRLAAAQGIDILNLVKSVDDVQAEEQQAMQAEQENIMLQQTGKLASAPIMDPSKNPEAMEMINGGNEAIPPEEGAPV